MQLVETSESPPPSDTGIEGKLFYLFVCFSLSLFFLFSLFFLGILGIAPNDRRPLWKHGMTRARASTPVNL